MAQHGQSHTDRQTSPPLLRLVTHCHCYSVMEWTCTERAVCVCWCERVWRVLSWAAAPIGCCMLLCVAVCGSVVC